MAEPRKAVRVLVGTTLLSRISVGRGEALALVEVGTVAFFAAGIAERSLGPTAPLVLLAAVVLGLGLRAVDLETCALFVPGGLYGIVQHALGRSSATVAAAALLVQHLLFGALAASAA